MSEILDALNTLHVAGIEKDVIKELATELAEVVCDDIKPLVLVAVLGAGMLDADETTYDDCQFDAGGGCYLVLDEDEKEERLENYLDECVEGAEGADGPYFDRDAWKRDARMEGAGHCLSSYDGREYEFNAAGTWYHIFRVN